MRKLYALSIAAAMLLTPALISTAQAESYTASKCWQLVRKAKTGLNTVSSKSKRKALVDLIIEAELNKRSNNYGACVDLAQTAIEMSNLKK